MKLPVGYVDVRFSVHATEDVEKAKKAAYNLFPPDVAEEVTFKKSEIKGHYGNPITLFEARIKDKKLVEALVGKLSTGLGGLDKDTLLREWDLLLEKSNLYLRLDKQAALGDEFRLQQADPIHIRIHFTKRDPQSIVEACRELGLIP